MNRTTTTRLFLVAICIFLLLYVLNRTSNGSLMLFFFQEKIPFKDLKTMIDFIPKTPEFSCEELFIGTPAQKYNMTPRFHEHYKEFHGISASSGRFPTEEYRALHYAMGQKFVKTYCETGFNAGSSSFYALTANDQAAVHSFEIGGDLFREANAKWLAKVFSPRFSIHLGDSTKSVPEFAKQNPDFRCDFMYVDGGHVYPVAKADMINFANIANLDHNFIAFDDYPPGWDNPNFGKAWDESVADGTVKEVMRCAYKNFGSVRGFTLGVVMKHPNGGTK